MGKEGIISLCQNLCHNLHHNLLQDLCHDVRHHKKNREVEVNNILQVLNKEAIAKVKVIFLLAKRTKRAIKVRMKKKTKTNRGVDPLRSLKEGENNQDTTSEVIHDL